MSTIVSSSRLSRRDFLAGFSAGSLVLMAKVTSGEDVEVAKANKKDVESFAPDLFVSIATDGTVTIIAHRSEMGTGIRTGLPRIVADELEADWDRVVIQQAPGDRRLGSQNTDGSNSIRNFFDRMRTAGATARTMLERAAAKQWKVAPATCRAENHEVKHKTKGSLGFGELVKVAKTLDVPKAAELKFKPPAQWRYIGKAVPVTDLNDIVTGKAVYGIDARMKNQVFAVIARPPVVGGVVRSFDAAKTKKMPGVVDVVEIPKFEGAPLFQPLGGVAVCANSTWAAWQGRDALKIKWDHGPNASYDTATYAKALTATVNKPGKVVLDQGDAPGALADAKNVVKADYSVPHLSHAPMEPTCAVADVKTDADGKVTSCHVVCATQNPQAVQSAVGKSMGMKPADVLVNVTLLGSAFGRKSKPDYCVEAAMLSRTIGRPVHVTWTREDDLSHDYLHTISAVHLEAAIGKDGKPTAWLQRVAYPSIGSTFNPKADAPAGFEVEMGLKDLPYDVPNIRLETGKAKAHVRIGWLRSVAHIQQIFAADSFLDELAHQAKRDPLEFLLEMLGKDRHLDLKARGHANRRLSLKDYPFDIGRLKHVVRRAAALADWKRSKDLPKGRGLGVACARSFEGFMAYVVEVDVAKKGTVRIPKVWGVLDTGIIVSPDRVRAQIEGGAIMAAGQAMFGKLTFSKGRAEQTNFDEYKITTMVDAPQEVFVELVKSDAKPGGAGEVPIPPFAPALCNAIFAATGKRIRDLPIAGHDLSWS